MDIIAPITPNSYSVAAINPAKSVDSAVQHNLLPQQFLQATVVSGGSTEAVLDFAGQKVPVQTEQTLASGQKLNLQVVATEPQLKLQIVADGADPALLRLVHVFDHRSDLGSKVAQLLQQRLVPTQATANSQVSSSTINPSTTPPTNQPTTPTATPTATPTVTPTVTPTATLLTTANTLQSATLPTSAAATAAVSGGQASTVPPAIPGITAGANGAVTAQVVPSGAQNAEGVATSAQGAAATNVANASSALAANSATSASANLGAQGATQPVLAAETQTTLPTSAPPLAAVFSAQQWQQLEQLATGLTSAMDQPNEKLLVNMARMLGLDFEFLTAQKLTENNEAATHGLKGMLSSVLDNGDIASAVREQASSMTQQLESLQLCRLRLAQDGVLFLPLPLDFLEQGYVLFEQQSQQNSAEDNAAAQPSYLVSINLSMAELGPIQANLLFEQQQLFVRIKCADDASATAVRQSIDELRQGLQEFNLGSVQVTTGAEDPALELLRRLQPQASADQSLFDTRV